MNPETTQELVRDARCRLAEAVSDYAAAFDRPGLVTGYVVVFELTELGGIPQCWWMTGTGGKPTVTSSEGLAAHRALELVSAALRLIKKTIA